MPVNCLTVSSDHMPKMAINLQKMIPTLAINFSPKHYSPEFFKAFENKHEGVSVDSREASKTHKCTT